MSLNMGVPILYVFLFEAGVKAFCMRRKNCIFIAGLTIVASEMLQDSPGLTV